MLRFPPGINRKRAHFIQQHAEVNGVAFSIRIISFFSRLGGSGQHHQQHVQLLAVFPQGGISA